MALLTKEFPLSLHALRRSVGWSDSFSKFVVCPKCDTSYQYKDCITTVGSQRLSKCCNYVKYPNHTHSHRREPCGAVLLKTVEFTSGRNLLYPFKVYCYKSLQTSLQTLLLCPGFYSKCQLWCSRPPHDLLEDVYDGNIWKEFQHIMGSPFLTLPFAFAFILNVDWFQPYTHTTASVGVIYLTILNLPRFLCLQTYKCDFTRNYSRTP